MTRTPASIPITAVRGWKSSPLFGSVNPTRVEQAEQPFGEQQPEAAPPPPTRTTPTTSASITIDVSTCRREAPSVRTGRELACALRDGDRQRVRDHERPDEEGDPAEGQQEASQEADELVRLLGVVASLRLGGLGPACRAGDLPRRRPRAAPGLTPGFAAIRIWSSVPSLPNSCCAVGRSKPRSVAPPIDSAPPNRTSPEMRRRLDRGPPPGRRSRPPARGPSSTPWRRPDHDLGSAPGQAPALPSSQRVELRLGRGRPLKPRLGAPPNTIASPSSSIRARRLAGPHRRSRPARSPAPAPHPRPSSASSKEGRRDASRPRPRAVEGGPCR